MDVCVRMFHIKIKHVEEFQPKFLTNILCGPGTNTGGEGEDNYHP